MLSFTLVVAAATFTAASKAGSPQPVWFSGLVERYVFRKDCG
jgi:hypothetical protein